MQSGLTIISDFDSLHGLIEMKDENLEKLFMKVYQQSFMTKQTFDIRDEARQLLEKYIHQLFQQCIDHSYLSTIPPPIILEKQARFDYYYHLIFFDKRH